MDKTVYRPRGSEPIRSIHSENVLVVRFDSAHGDRSQQEFRQRFVAGRDASIANLVLNFENVSRRHFVCYPDRDGWCIDDLDSANGLYVVERGGKVLDDRIRKLQFSESIRVRVGMHGPFLDFSCGSDVSRWNQHATDHSARQSAGTLPHSPTEFINRYLSDNSGLSHEGQVIRQAVDRVSGRRSNRYKYLAVLGVVLAIGLAVVLKDKQKEIERLETSVVEISSELNALKSDASSLFYEMREAAANSGHDPKARRNLEMLEEKYNEHLDRLGFDYSTLTEEEQLILKMARVFGESELEMPRDFLVEVQRYIAIWQKSDTLKISIERARSNGYISTIRTRFVDNYLPPQFFYIGLQESAFNDRAIGPATRWGIAKGIWQFIPDTAVRYGLKVGPLREEREYDSRDERFDFEKATEAAAKYLSYIYTTEAQASGLLVIASYNWGENRIRKRVNDMRNHPRDRNFWNFLKQYDMPKETRDYVLKIFSAAVIGENPALFGFDFQNPLAVND